MKVVTFPTRGAALLVLVMFISGCSEPTSNDQEPVEISGPPPATGELDHGEEHEGPHGGHVIELGRSHEYHAELVDDEQAETVTVYILDKDLKELPIEQQSLTLNLIVDGVAKMFEMSAARSTGEMTSQFSATDKAAFEALHEHEALGKLSVTINGTPYSGAVEHHEH